MHLGAGLGTFGTVGTVGNKAMLVSDI